MKWFSKKEIKDLEQNNSIRDNVPVLRIINYVENNANVDFIEWEQPEYIKEIMKLLEKGNIEKRYARPLLHYTIHSKHLKTLPFI